MGDFKNYLDEQLKDEKFKKKPVWHLEWVLYLKECDKKKEGRKDLMTYPNIDMIQTGLQLKKYINQAGMSIKDIQEYLHLSCPQPVYRWIKGKILPSVDHLLMLSELFGVHMEKLLVKKEKDNLIIELNSYDTSMAQDRNLRYWGNFIHIFGDRERIGR